MGDYFGTDGEIAAELSAINTTPLVDVMLVLLIIFLITVPVVSAAIPVALPRQSAPALDGGRGAVALTIDRHGQVFWQGDLLPDPAALAGRLAATGAGAAIRLHADEHTAYGRVAAVIDACGDAGITTLSFVTEPPVASGQ